MVRYIGLGLGSKQLLDMLWVTSIYCDARFWVCRVEPILRKHWIISCCHLVWYLQAHVQSTPVSNFCTPLRTASQLSVVQYGGQLTVQLTFLS